MPIHDWTQVDAGIFHDFHLAWIAEIRRTLNQGLLPPGYYALAEQVAGDFGPDVLSLQRPSLVASADESEPAGGVAVAAAPPRTRFHARVETDDYAAKARTVVIRHRSGHKVVAMVEIVSPGNKSGQFSFRSLVYKTQQALLAGVHLLIVDLFPPTPRDPQGLHRAIWDQDGDGDFPLPADKPLTCVSYVAGPGAEVYLDPVAVGDVLPDMPLFLTRGHYVPIPLEKTYLAAWEGVPDFLQEILTAPPAGRNGQAGHEQTPRN